jgi:hypothetical protein
MAKLNTVVLIAAAVTLGFILLPAQNMEAGPGKGAKTNAHMSVKGRANTNAQWSADPEKGWVRADERQQIEKDKKQNIKRNQVNRKGNGSKKNREENVERKKL